jgi:hypothetical protein
MLANDLDSLQVRHWELFCRRTGAHEVNLFPLFVDPRRSRPETEALIGRLCVPGDYHWNRLGHQMVADALIADWRSNPQSHGVDGYGHRR